MMRYVSTTVQAFQRKLLPQYVDNQLAGVETKILRIISFLSHFSSKKKDITK